MMLETSPDAILSRWLISKGAHYRRTSSRGCPWTPCAPVNGLLCLAAALADYAPPQGIIHRDLKPSNIMVDGHGEPIITDFGLALRLDRDDPELKRTDPLMGTPHYMAPEQVVAAEEPIGPA